MQQGERPRRAQGYTLAIGVVIGMIVSGVLVPFVVGRDATDGGGTVDAAAGATSLIAINDTVAGIAASADSHATTATTAATGGAGPSSVVGGPTPAVPGQRLTATDIGVSAAAVKLGVLVADLGGVDKLGINADGGDPEQQYRAFVDDINKRGGVNGRKVDVVFRHFQIIQQDSQQPACVALAEDAKVFAALSNGGFFGSAVECLTRDHHVPLITSTDSSPEGFYRESGGRLFSELTNKHRILRNLVGELDRMGSLRGHKIGIVDADLPADKPAVDGGLVPALAQLGYTVTLRQTMAADTSTAASQVPVIVQKMRAAGVDTILLPMNIVYAAQFVRGADGQRYYPKYFSSDFAQGTSDTAVAAMPPSYDGTIGFTATRSGEHRTSAPEAPIDAACRTTFEKATGTKLDRGSGPYQATMGVCGLMQQFELAARLAGPSLTRDRFSLALRQQTNIAMPFFGGSASYGPAKFDAADSLRMVKASTSCSCWIPVGEFHRVRF